MKFVLLLRLKVPGVENNRNLADACVLTARQRILVQKLINDVAAATIFVHLYLFPQLFGCQCKSSFSTQLAAQFTWNAIKEGTVSFLAAITIDGEELRRVPVNIAPRIEVTAHDK